jgi:hypothetical protein
MNSATFSSCFEGISPIRTYRDLSRQLLQEKAVFAASRLITPTYVLLPIALPVCPGQALCQRILLPNRAAQTTTRGTAVHKQEQGLLGGRTAQPHKTSSWVHTAGVQARAQSPAPPTQRVTAHAHVPRQHAHAHAHVSNLQCPRQLRSC